MSENKNKSNKKKIQYFQVDKFVEDVITAMKLGDTTAPVLLELQNAIAQKLGDRILFTVVNSFQERELRMFENMLNDHPELTELDCLWLTAHEIEGLKDKLIKEVNALYAELVYDADKIDQSLKNKVKK